MTPGERGVPNCRLGVIWWAEFRLPKTVLFMGKVSKL